MLSVNKHQIPQIQYRLYHALHFNMYFLIFLGSWFLCGDEMGIHKLG
jgi:hypothetical protein